jgi:hypothetical protein
VRRSSGYVSLKPPRLALHIGIRYALLEEVVCAAEGVGLVRDEDAEHPHPVGGRPCRHGHVGQPGRLDRRTLLRLLPRVGTEEARRGGGLVQGGRRGRPAQARGGARGGHRPGGAGPGGEAREPAAARRERGDGRRKVKEMRKSNR